MRAILFGKDDKDQAQVLQRRRTMVAEFYSKYGMFAILLLIILMAAALNENFIKIANLLNILRTMSSIGLAAFGMTFILILGMIDLSVGSVMALAGCVACVITKNTGLVIPAILIGVLIGGAFGLLNGAIVTGFGIPAFIMTLATQNIARGISLLITNGGRVIQMGDDFRILGQGYIFNVIPIPIVIMFAFLLISHIVLTKTTFGCHVFAAGGNPYAAKVSNVNVTFTVLMSFLINGLFVGLAGVMLMSRLYTGLPDGATGYEFSAVTAVVVGGTSLMGGTGSVLGTFVGALIVAIIDNVVILQGIDIYWQYIIKGIVIALAVIVDFKTKASLSKAE